MKKKEIKPKKRYYLRFYQCICGCNQHSLHQATDGKWYYACKVCGRNSFDYRAEDITDVKRGWNQMIEDKTNVKKSR